MTTQHLRARRMLSMHRRTGLQIPPEVAAGRCQRGEQGWRDNIPHEPEALRAAHGLIGALCALALGLACVGIIAVAGVIVVDDILPAMVGVVRTVVAER